MKRPIAVKFAGVILTLAAFMAAALAVVLPVLPRYVTLANDVDIAQFEHGIRVGAVLFGAFAAWCAAVSVLFWMRHRAGWVLAVVTALAGIAVAMDDVMIFGLFSEDGMPIFIPAALTVLLLVPSVLRWFLRQHRTAVEATAVPQH